MKYIFLFFLIFITSLAQAQPLPTFNDSLATARNQLVKRSMLTLGSWAVANIATGFGVAGSTQGQTKYFWHMNGYFNLVNLGLAGMGYLGALKATQKKYSLTDNIEQQARFEKIYLLNLGLDLAYIGVGAYLNERGDARSTLKSQQELKGYGTSIIVQGGFLLLMDGIVFLLHHRNTARLYRKLQLMNINN